METPSYKPWWLDDPEYLKALRTFCKRAVLQIWNNENRPTKDRHEIAPIVHSLILEDKYNEWKWAKPSPDKTSTEYQRFHDSVVRRLNECADEKYWEGPTPLISLDPKEPGKYAPNWALWEEPYRTEILRTLASLGFNLSQISRRTL